MIKPQATQLLTASDKIQRRAQCPDHKAWSSNYQGTDVHGWLFRCRERHLFYAKPDRTAPTSYPEVQDWVARQKYARIAKLDKRQ